MSVRYIRVNPVANLFAPAVRAYGNLAIVGTVTPPAMPPADLAVANVPIVFTSPDEALRRCPGDLGNSIALAFSQTPGPTIIFGVRSTSATDIAAALTAVSTLDAQLVMLANTPLNGTTGTTTGAIAQLAQHVTTTSNTGGDGKERMGVAMLEKNSTNAALVTGTLANERMTYIAHKSDQDAAAAFAGTIAGYEPHISILLKPVNITSDSFTSAEIQTLNGSESFSSGPAGQGVNWLVDPLLIPGRGIYAGEGYTGNPGGKKYIDIVRTVDDVSFKLKAQLINTIGTLRISRSGLRALTVQMESVLEPLVRNEVIEGYTITIPVLTLLDKDPNSLTAAELAQINNAQNQRVVEVLIAVDYAGAIHRLAITLKFE
jgi:hypothetical protein